MALLLAGCYKPNKKKESVVNETQKESLSTIGSEQKRKKRWLQHQTDDVTQGGEFPKSAITGKRWLRHQTNDDVMQESDIPQLAMADKGFAALQPETEEKTSAGGVRANLPLSDGKLTSGSIDFFYPLYDGDEHLFFGQVGARRSDGRSIVNFGIGQRYFQGDWALGYNTFYDTQISGNAHQRLGFGLEYWRDYLYLSANGYFGLTDWYSSSALDGYAERAANGYDIRAQGWFPAYPQLSGKLKFEQYFGDDIALLNHQNHYKDPYALTVGLEYTPIKLISLGIDRTFSHRGKDDTKVNLSFNYQLGEPLSQQIDPTTAPVRRTLADNRYHLVERNNNNVPITLSAPVIESVEEDEAELLLLTGEGNEERPLLGEEEDELLQQQQQEEELRRQQEEERLEREAQDAWLRQEEELRRQQEEELRRQQEEELRRQQEEELRRQQEEELRRQQENELQRQQEEELRRQQEEELRRQQEEELRRQQEEELRRQQEEELRRQQENELQRQQEEELRRQQEEELRRQQEEE
ncbi:hypothetical protein EAE89_22045, partial [Photorhabdus heterorhabditis]|nr:hypothetical protein [Photorhabdus heterorhabditis]